jgi:hypothetical protein
MLILNVVFDYAETRMQHLKIGHPAHFYPVGFLVGRGMILNVVFDIAEAWRPYLRTGIRWSPSSYP